MDIQAHTANTATVTGPDWLLYDVKPTGRTDFPWRVRGVNLNTNEPFDWQVPSLVANSTRYEVAGSRLEVDAQHRPGSPAVFLGQTHESAEFMFDLFATFRARNYSWVRLRVVDSRTAERFDPIILNEIGAWA